MGGKVEEEEEGGEKGEVWMVWKIKSDLLNNNNNFLKKNIYSAFPTFHQLSKFLS